MSEEEKKAAEAAKAEETAKVAKEVSDLKTQIENLNKGIAGYRDTAQKAEELAKQAKAEAEELKKKVPPAKDVKLSDEEREKFEALAKEKGFVDAETLRAEANRAQAENFKSFENQAVAEFLEKHPEFDKDEEWKKITDEFALFKTPTSLVGYRNLLNKVYTNLTGKSSKDAKGEARAEIINRSRLSLGGGRAGGASESPLEANIDTLQAKYPNLSRDVIEGRLAELKALYPKK